MGCDIHTFALRKTETTWYLVTKDRDLRCEWQETEFLGWRSYGMFSFLTNGVVRNYSELPETKRLTFTQDAFIEENLAKAADADYGGGHTPRILELKTLLEFDYDQIMVDKRAGDNTVQTYREFLGQCFFDDLEEMKRKGVTHFAFYFDN